MKLTLSKIVDAGILSKERIVIKVLADVDVGKFAVFESLCRNDHITTGIEDVMWFPDKKVAEGDIVVLYTKGGKQNEKELKSGHRSHFFYWGSKDAKWVGSKTAPVLVFVSDWETIDT